MVVVVVVVFKTVAQFWQAMDVQKRYFDLN